MTYVNSTFFAVLLVPLLIRYIIASSGAWRSIFYKQERPVKYEPLAERDQDASGGHNSEAESALPNGHITDAPVPSRSSDASKPRGDLSVTSSNDRLDIRETAWLSFEFSMIWVRRLYL